MKVALVVAVLGSLMVLVGATPTIWPESLPTDCIKHPVSKPDEDNPDDEPHRHKHKKHKHHKRKPKDDDDDDDGNDENDDNDDNDDNDEGDDEKPKHKRKKCKHCHHHKGGHGDIISGVGLGVGVVF